MRYEKIMKQLKSFNFTDAQRKKLTSIILKLDKEKQDILVSGDNIATINGQSLLNGGDISLIKTGIFSIVTELPTNDIDKDKVYLVPSTKTDNENRFSEYIYTDNGWEKLGEFKSEIDLSNYVQKTDIVTNTTNGLMLASDKVKLDAFEEAEQYTKATNLPDSVISNADVSSDANSVTLKYTKDSLIDGSNSEVNLQIPAATDSNAGIVNGHDYRRIRHISDKFIGLNGLGDLLRLTHDSDSISLHYGCIDIYTGYEEKVIKINKANSREAGVISTSDKTKLDGIENSAQVNKIESVSINGTPLEITNKGVNIPNATTSKEGLMSKEDKAKLDSQPTIKASNATEVTNDDYVVIKKSELDSILSRLSALENKA